MAQINKPNQYFNTVTYTGTNSALNLTVGFQPDMYWIKCRDNAHSHVLGDAVRGIGNGTSKVSYTDLTSSEGTCASGQGIIGVTSTQLQLGSETNTSGSTNGASKTYVAWNWLGANGTASNTDGSITSTISANTTSGFSIVSYTGTGSPGTVGHGLGTTPSMIIVKDRTTAGEYWHVYHKSLGATKAVYLNTTDASVTTSGSWNDTSPTSTVFSNGTLLDTTSANFIAYCFAEKKGFSKFGSYTGNGSTTDGTFIYTGFKPAWVLTKSSSNAATQWTLKDNKRNTFNACIASLYPNLSAAEDSDSNIGIDFLSNGFKLYGNYSGINASGYTYIFMAFAENPLVGTNNIPATAR